MHKHSIWVALIFAGLAASSPAATFVWDNSSTDNEWTNPPNWTNNASFPGSADTAKFDDTMIGTCRIGANVTVASLIISNYSGTIEFNIPAGVTLKTILYQQAYKFPNSFSRVIMYGGGTFAPTGDVWLALLDATWKSSEKLGVSPVISN